MSSVLTRLACAVSDLRVEPALPNWATVHVWDREEAIEIAQRDASSSWAGYLRYVDTAGKESQRRIVCKAIEGYGRAETITAYCCERRSSRRFRIDRIQELICLSTGEVLDPLDHFEQLRMRGALKVIDKSLCDLGRILVFMARCDGSVHPMEADAIEHGLTTYVLRHGGDDRVLETALRNSGKIAPDGDDLVASLERIRLHPEAKAVARLVLDCMGRVAIADGCLHSEEIEWTRLAEDYLKQVALPR